MAVHAIHTCCTAGDQFEDACDECQDNVEDAGDARTCHLGPEWVVKADEDSEEQEKNIWRDTHICPIMQIPWCEEEGQEEFGAKMCDECVDAIASKAPDYARWVDMGLRHDSTADKNLWVCCTFARRGIDPPFES